jgi:hypothetical protein
MFETHSQIINFHLSTGIAESFTGGKVKILNRLEIGIHSHVEGITKGILFTIHKFNAIANLAIAANAEISTILGIYKC